MKFQKLSGNQKTVAKHFCNSAQAAADTNTIQNVAVELFRKTAFHVLYIIHVHIDVDAYQGKLQSKNMIFMSREGQTHNIGPLRISAPQSLSSDPSPNLIWIHLYTSTSVLQFLLELHAIMLQEEPKRFWKAIRVSQDHSRSWDLASNLFLEFQTFRLQVCFASEPVRGSVWWQKFELAVLITRLRYFFLIFIIWPWIPLIHRIK